jgi:hypothetical protein
MYRFTKPIFRTSLLVIAALSLGACQYFQPQVTGQTEGTEYKITITNFLPGEKFAPILVVGDADDSKIWVGDYVSDEAYTQFTTGNNGPLAKVLGGDQGQPGKLGAGDEISFTFRSKAKTVRITAMVHPDITPDNYVTTLVNLESGSTIELQRFDIGDDEGRNTVQLVGPAGKVTIL